MSESVKVKEIEMELKPYETMCDEATEYLRTLITGGECADPQTILAVAKTVGEIVDVKKDIVEMCYKKQIIEAMEENAEDFGETWNEDGPMAKKYYPRMRDSRGRYMSRRGYDEMMLPETYRRDMDIENGRMYSMENESDGIEHKKYYGGMGNSNYEMSKRSYEEHKQMNPTDNSGNMAKLEVFLKSIDEGMEDIAPMMNQNEKAMAKDKMMRSLNRYFI